MMKKRTVRIISCVIAGILVVAMLVSMLASSLTFAAAAEDADSLRDKLSTLEDEKAAVKERIAELTREANDVQATRDALQSEIDLTKEEITTVEAYIDRLQEQIDVKTSELEVAEDALSEKEAQFAKSVRTTYELGRHFADLCRLLSPGRLAAPAYLHHGLCPRGPEQSRSGLSIKTKDRRKIPAVFFV